MTNQKPITPDTKRLETLETAFKEFRLYFSEEKSSAKKWLLFKHQFRKYYFMLPPIWRVALRIPSWKKRIPFDFVSTGAVRSGTSSLSSYIFQHPCVVLPLAKEILTWHKTSILMAQLPHKKEKKKILNRYGAALCGTGTPVVPSMAWPHVAQSINPDLKIVIILRNPTQRVISQWRWDRMVGKQLFSDPLTKFFPDFDDHMLEEIANHKYGNGFSLISGAVKHSYLANSIYLPFIKKVRAIFGEENIKIICAEEFFKNPLPIVKNVYSFLGLPEYDPIEIKETNPSFPVTISDDTVSKISEFFRPLNDELYEYLDKDLGWE
ncbi:MAG: hypothetical protein D6B27_02100 [Gammaproteobacteria bacterium]|nr:MAG: hypothetical protein D6B27_02100 [Gammaproteobacteria bacterium]